MQPGGHGFEPRRLHTRRQDNWTARVDDASLVARLTRHCRSAETSARDCDRWTRTGSGPRSRCFRSRPPFWGRAVGGGDPRKRVVEPCGSLTIRWVIRVASNDDSDVPARGGRSSSDLNTSLRSRELDRYFAPDFTRSSGRVARRVLCSTGPARGLEDRNNAAKLLRACGGCLGASRR